MKQYLKSPYSIAIVAILAVGAIHLAFFHKWCEEPTVTQVQTAKVACAMELMLSDMMQLQSEACVYIGKTTDCALSSEDSPQIEKFVVSKVNKCIEVRFNKANLCTDKIGK